MGRKIAAIIGFVIAGLLVGGAHAEDAIQRIKKKGVLVVGVPYDLPPFGFFDPDVGGLAGYDVDAANTLAEILGVRLELKPIDAKTRIPALLGGHVDLVAGNLTADPDIGKVIAFSDVYLTTGVGFIAKKGSVRGLKDLKGKKIAVGTNTVAHDSVEDSIPGAIAVVFDDLYPALDALESGSVAAGAGDSSILPVLLPMLPEGAFEVLPFQIAELPHVVGVRRDDKALLDFLNQTIQEMHKNGRLEGLYSKWFQAQPQPEAQEEGPAAAAAAVISRKAATRPRFVAVILRGEFLKGAEISVFSTDGEFVSTGTVASVFADEIYLDVDPEKYEFVRSGYAVGMHVNQAKAKTAILEHQDVLKSVRSQAEEDAKRVAAEIDAEGKAQEQRRAEADKMAYQQDLAAKTIRARDRDNRYYYRGYRGGRSYRGGRYRRY